MSVPEFQVNFFFHLTYALVKIVDVEERFSLRTIYTYDFAMHFHSPFAFHSLVIPKMHMSLFQIIIHLHGPWQIL